MLNIVAKKAVELAKRAGAIIFFDAYLRSHLHCWCELASGKIQHIIDFVIYGKRWQQGKPKAARNDL